MTEKWRVSRVPIYLCLVDGRRLFHFMYVRKCVDFLCGHSSAVPCAPPRRLDRQSSVYVDVALLV